MASDWLKEAMQLQQRGAHADALRACDLAPNTPRARFAGHIVRAVSLAALGRRSEARTELAAAHALGAPSRVLCQLALDACRALGEPALGQDFADAALDAFGVKQNTLLAQREAFVKQLRHLTGLAEQAERVAQLLPTHLEARRNLAAVYMHAHLYELALDELHAASELDPTRFDIWRDKAVAHLELGDTRGAVRTLERMGGLAWSPDEARELGRLFFRAGSLEQAFGLADERRAAEPQSADARLLCARYALFRGELDEARALLSGEDAPGPTADRERALLAHVEGRHADALEHAARAMEQSGSDAELHVMAAAAHLRLSQFAKAGESLDVASSRQARWHPASELVRASIELEQYATVRGYLLRDCIAAFGPLLGLTLEGLDLSGDVPSSTLRDAVRDALARLSGNFTSDQTYLHGPERAIRRLAPPQPVRTACLRAAAAIEARPWEFAIERVLGLESGYPGSPLVHTHAAELHLWLGDYHGCETHCRRALSISETEGSRWAWVGLGAALAFQGREQEALDVFARSDRLMEPGAPLRAYRGETLRRLGRLAEARLELQASLDRTPTRTSAWIQLALISDAQGDTDAARQSYDQLRQGARGLVEDLEREMRASNSEAQGPAAILQAALAAMRGNRSSGRITYFLSDGHARSIPARDLGRR